MFGYIKMDKDAPKAIRDNFKKMYCLQCRALDKHYGLLSRMFVSEDVTFMMLLAAEDNYLAKLKKVKCLKTSETLKEFLNDGFAKKFAALNLCFVEAELLDNITDDKNIFNKMIYGIFKPTFKKVKKDYPEMHQDVIDGYYVLYENEKNNAGMQQIGEAFAKFITNISQKHLGISDESKLSYLAFLAKWLYFIDGIDDLTKDYKHHKYNPFIEYQSSQNLINNNYMVIKNYVDEMYRGLKIIKSESLDSFTFNRVINYSIPVKTRQIIERRSK